ncbi:sulfate transporter family protein [Rhizobium ruizarguesonis]|uniref:Sulfate transporter family protein n=1 Tax=Rhizobium ruizarguesonis TaxID=2081791 RepID=A0AAE4YXT3_9HYPH|nr:sulfate transporter family protein [Rhizobium ruizarguesonis]MBY5881401.1 sulfate transporter family protein [Rhizobium leguminosarum]QIO46224.1 sulfate transporter family protein [Rhizobium leguminosarum bv. trifolii]TBY59089.1 sulfate transporter family protein [Rhizobium leguminosarum bv. viciae]MBY5898240.1 sulfate transporter family protein [Rhizobium leguminosarum]MCB2401732.1 sulfate transporter family protein [Rhizobium ruizarguesonis]
MILDAARLSLANLFASETRSVFWKVLGLTILVLVGLWFALRGAFMAFLFPWLTGFFPDMPDWAGWLAFLFAILAGIGLALMLALLLSPVTALIAGLFLDDVADVIEKRDYPKDAPGTAMPLGPAMASSIKFLGVVILGNIVALLLLFIPGVNLVAFFLVNGYLLGREFFEFAAMRSRSPDEARLFRTKHASTVFLGGLVIALFLAIPIVNLLTPLFAAGMMVHLHKLVSAKDPGLRA